MDRPNQPLAPTPALVTPLDADSPSESALRSAELEQLLACSNAQLEATRKELQVQLAESRRLAAIVESSNDAIIGMNLDGTILSFNKGAEQIYGYTAQEAVGRSSAMLLPADRSGELAALLERLRHGETSGHFRTRRVRKDGQLLVASVCVSPVVDAAGYVVGASSIARDITEQERLESILRLQGPLAANFADGICIIRARDMKVVYTNERLEKMLGCARDALLGKPVDFLRATGHRDAFETAAVMLHALHESGVWMSEVQSIWNESECYWCQAHRSADENPNHRMISLIVRSNVSERRRVALALRANEERLRLAIEATGMGIWFDPITDGVIDWSEPLKRIWGLAADAEITHDLIRALVHPDDLPDFDRTWRQALDPRGDGRFIIEHRVCRPDGSSAWVFAWGQTCFDGPAGSRRPSYSTGVVLDITERKRAEKAARDSQNRLQLIADALPVLIAYIDTDWRFQFNNAGFERWHNRPRAAFQGRLVSETLPADVYESIAPYMAEALRGELRTFERRFRYADGHVRDVEIHYVPHRDEQQNVLGICVLAIDVSERRKIEKTLRENEDRLSAIVSTASDAIITFDENGTIESANAAAEGMYGWTGAAMVGRSVNDLFAASYPGIQSALFGAGQNRADQGMSGLMREALGRRQDGSTFPLEMTVSTPGRFRGVTAILRDITRRKALQLEVLEIAAREQRRIGQDLHDNTGQELTALGLLSETLVEALREGTGDVPALAGAIVAGIKRALAQVRTLARGLVPVEVDASGLMAALQHLAKRADGVQGIHCIFARRDPVLVEDNQTATHLYRIAQEAVANALRHSRARHVSIRLEENPQSILLEIHDDGIGLPHDAQDGQGMGLKIMAYRAGLINAYLSIEAAEPRGTTVKCKLARWTAP